MSERLSMSAQRSIVICGGAFAGLALAVALRQGLGGTFPSSSPIRRLATRPSAIPAPPRSSAPARRLFETLGVWDKVADGAQPILDMVVTDSKLEDAMRPMYLTFGGEVEPGEPFAHMVENRRLVDALVARAKAEGVDLRASAVATLTAARDGIDVTLADGARIGRNFWSPPTARARKSASAPASRHMAGTTISPASSSRSVMSVTIRAAPRSISCRPGRSRSCR